MPTASEYFTASQEVKLQEEMRRLYRADQILYGARGMGLDVPEIGVLRSGSIRRAPDDPFPIATLHITLSWCQPIPHPSFTGLRSDIDPVSAERFHMSSPVESASRNVVMYEPTECEVLSPADTAIELTAEDVRHLDRADSLLAPWKAFVSGYLEGGIGHENVSEWTPGVENDGTFYTISHTGRAQINRSDGTILPIGNSLGSPGSLDGEREEMIRPRIEDLRE